jgi:hypothetical protein
MPLLRGLAHGWAITDQGRLIHDPRHVGTLGDWVRDHDRTDGGTPWIGT